MTHAVDALITPAILHELRDIVGADGLISGENELLVYECDAYTLEKHLPGVVVLPRTTDEVVAVTKLCARHQLPIIPRGAGTSLSGTVLAVTGGVISWPLRTRKNVAPVPSATRPCWFRKIGAS